jgi:hypothetical protein
MSIMSDVVPTMQKRRPRLMKWGAVPRGIYGVGVLARRQRRAQLCNNRRG